MSLAEDVQFKEGQKLEAVDPLEMSRICPATIGKVHSNISDLYLFIASLLGIEKWLYHVIC